MLDKILKYATPILLALIFTSELIGILAPQGMSQEDHEYQVKIHDLEQEKEVLKQQNEKQEELINKFKNEKTQIDSITDGYNTNQLDSFFTDFIGTR